MSSPGVRFGVRVGVTAVTALSAAATVGTLSGCGGDKEVGVQVRMTLDALSCMAVGGHMPDLVPLPCDTTIGVWLLTDDGNTVLAQDCLVVADAPSRTLEMLPELLASAELDLSALSDGDKVAMEVAIYSPARSSLCPRFDPFTSGTEDWPILFGTSPALLLSSSSPEIPVKVVCTGVDLALADCVGTAQVAVSTTMIDLGTLRPWQRATDELFGTFGRLISPGAELPSMFEPVSALLRDGDATVWTASVPATLIDPDCPATRAEEVQPGGGGTVSCEGEFNELAKVLTTVGYFLDGDTEIEIRAALGAFDMGHLIVGRVVNASGDPVAGATVALDGTTAVVKYPNADMSDVTSDGVTADHGYFAIDSLPGEQCCFTVLAEAPGDLSGSSAGKVGLLEQDNSAAVVIVQ